MPLVYQMENRIPKLKHKIGIQNIGNLDRAGDTTILFIFEEAKETTLNFSQGTVRVL